IDGLEFLARPVRGERFLPKCLQSAQTKIAYPIRVLLHIRDVVDGALAQAHARVAHVSFRVKEITLTAINIDGCRFGFHLLLPRKHWFGSSLACPIVASFLELQSEFFSPAPNDSPSYHHMDVVGNDVVQEPLIVRYYQYPKVRPAQRIDSVRNGLERVDVKAAIGFIENGVLWLEHRHLQ